MKITCKKCTKKCKTGDIPDMECDNTKCDLKYDMHDEELDFKDWKYQETNFIMDITSPEPTVKVTKIVEIDEATWLAMMESGQFSDGMSKVPF